MQCPKCRAITANETSDMLYCPNCGSPLAEPSAPTTTLVNGEVSDLSTMQISNQPESEPTVQYLELSEATMLEIPQLEPNASAIPATPPLPSMGGAPTMEAGWAEFSGTSASSAVMPSGTETVYSPPDGYMPPHVYPQPVPGEYMSPSAYQQQVPGGYQYSYAPRVMPQIQSAPKRRRLLLAITLSVLVLLLIIGGVFAGIAIGQAHSKSTTTQASSTPNAQQLYQQVTSQSPSIVDSLQDAAGSTWFVDETSKGECKIQSDGLHIQANESNHFHYCTSGRGKFNNFAFQVDMTILSGNAGGITFRGDTSAGNLYAFLVYPDGGYRIALVRNNQVPTVFRDDIITSFNSGQQNTLTVIAQENQINIYVNQKLLTQLRDSTYTDGSIGVLADDYDAPAEVIYTNAKIWIL